jgi:hypothetical protein
LSSLSSQVSFGGIQIILGQCSRLQATTGLSTKSRYKDVSSARAIQTELHPDSIKMKGDVYLRKSWEPLLYLSMNEKRSQFETFFSSTFCLSLLFTVVLSAVCPFYPHYSTHPCTSIRTLMLLLSYLPQFSKFITYELFRIHSSYVFLLLVVLRAMSLFEHNFLHRGYDCDLLI